ncbi:hypothetical protein TraAM80_05349 [Trypanosoma rangeli]|uniref:Uncharacterized protein n=1 Tax=Trypanosoma rangeli TaxID=5698 RepID=A0A3R7KD53_TRYRA|nr:uncharacterized protein TraAM80_05349 [Trypanosoma rangeli]RNF04114.1 hypothetical protein TraAM80_05349 [Trypanosoma rangeli]|eukprot:RNF04114.1 hypothetical protein TraAM80_05349 [Trypanosoma rangeli]
MGKRREAAALETTPDLAFIKKGYLNMLIHTSKEGERTTVPVDSLAFLEDPRVVRSRSMDQVNFHRECVFKATLEFVEPVMCLEETAVRESTDWVLCSCGGHAAFYSPVEQRLVLQQCVVCLQSNVPELVDPFVLVLYLEGGHWLVERVLR